MSIFKRPNSRHWQIYIETQGGGKPIRCSSGTTSKKKAQEYHDKLKAESWEISKLNKKPEYIWEELAVQWLKECNKKSIEFDKTKIKWFSELDENNNQRFGGKKLSELTRDYVKETIATRKFKGKPISDSTKNRYTALVSVMMNMAVTLEWIESCPQYHFYDEPEGRERWEPVSRIKELLDQLPDHQSDPALFDCATGFRESNVTGLEWPWLDLDRCIVRIPSSSAKGKKEIVVPLNKTAMSVIVKQIGKHPKYVFTYKGNPVGYFYTEAFKKALKRAGIEDFHWHDLRHCWASWLANAGVPKEIRVRLGGWGGGRGKEMVDRYTHFEIEYLRKYSEIIDELFHYTFTTQPPVKQESVIVTN